MEKDKTKDDEDIFIEAVELLTHAILYTRGIYPPAIFHKKRAYSTAVYTSIYPPLNDYLMNCFATALDLKRAKKLHGIIVSIYKDDNYQLEKYVFEVMDLNFENETDKNLLGFEEAVKKCHLQLDAKLKHLEPLSKKAKFKIILQTTEAGCVSLEQSEEFEDFEWMHEDSQSNVARSVTILPIVAVNSLSIQLFLEELSQK